MDETVATTDPQAAPPADPEAPFGRRPDGTAYKRDPKFFEHLRGKGPRGRAAVRKTAGAKPAAPVDRPAPARKAKPDYAKRIVELSKGILPMVPNPVDRQILRQGIPPWAVALEQAALESPALASILDKVLLGNLMGGAWVGLSAATLELVGLLALNHGMAPHPAVVLMLGAKLDQLRLAALQEQADIEARAAQLRDLMGQEPDPEIREDLANQADWVESSGADELVTI